MSGPTPFEARLREELLAGIGRFERRRARRRAVARTGGLVLAALVVASAMVLGLLPGSRPEPVHSGPLNIMKRGDGAFVVKVADLEADPDAVRHQLREAGLGAVEIVDVPSPAHQVGRFLTLDYFPEGFSVLNGDGPTFTSFLVTPEVAEGLRLEIGRPARPGEMYARPVDAFGEHGPLHCSALFGARVIDAHDDIERLGLKVRWASSDGRLDVTAEELADHRIAAAALQSDRQLFVWTTPGPPGDHWLGKPADDSDCPASPTTSGP